MKGLNEQLDQMKSDLRCPSIIFETTFTEEAEGEWNELVEKMRKKSLLNNINNGCGNKPRIKIQTTFLKFFF